MRSSVSEFRRFVLGDGYLSRFALSFLCSMPFWQGATHAAQRELPNFVLFLADDLGYAELGCQGNTDIPTPHIDALAEEGVRFTNGYVTCSLCSPSRAGLLTGRYQNRFGYERNFTGPLNEDPRYGLPRREITIAEYLAQKGNVSAIIGKWHLGGTAQYHPYRHGFDEFFGFMHEGHYFVPPPYEGVTTWLRRRVLPWGGQGRWTSDDGKTIYTTHMDDDESDYDANNPVVRGSQPVDESEYLTDAFAREAVDFIERNQDRPFFLYMPFSAVHSPMQGKDEDMKRFARISDVHRRIFAAMLSNMDEAIGEVVNKIVETGLEEDTVFLFLSDNGGPTAELTSSNAPMRDGNGNIYEGGLRIPFIIKAAGRFPEGRVVDDPVIALDLFPTLAAMAGQVALPDYLDGVNLLPLLEGKNKGLGERTLYWSFNGKRAMRKGKWKWVQPNRSAKPELYNLDGDVGESKDLSRDYPEIAAEMKEDWSRLDKEIKEDG